MRNFFLESRQTQDLLWTPWSCLKIFYDALSQLACQWALVYFGVSSEENKDLTIVFLKLKHKLPIALLSFLKIHIPFIWKTCCKYPKKRVFAYLYQYLFSFLYTATCVQDSILDALICFCTWTRRYQWYVSESVVRELSAEFGKVNVLFLYILKIFKIVCNNWGYR